MDIEIDDDVFECQADLCQVLCNAKRLKILHILKEDEHSVSELAELTGISQPTVSQHLRKMRDKDVVVKRPDGNKNYYHIRDERLIDAMITMRKVLHAIEEEEQPPEA